MSTKIDIINGAYTQLRISGLTVDPTPEDLELALDRLEDMMAELTARNICTHYAFELTPDPNTDTQVDRKYNQMMKTNLALRLVDFGKAIPPELFAQATQSLSTASSISSSENAQEVQYPVRMPRGSGNSRRNNRWRRFQNPSQLPPNECATNKMLQTEVNDYQEDFSAYLGTESITSYTMVVDPGLTLVSSSNDTPLINYRIQAGDQNTQGIWQQVKITITTSSGRKEIRLINFEIDSDITVGGVTSNG